MDSVLIDHLVYAAPDLAAAVIDLEDRLGVLARAGGRHTGLGTHNALLSLGQRTYLEIIAPDPGQPPPEGPRPFGLDDGAGPRLAGWAVACANLDAAIAYARSRGYDPGDAAQLERTGPAGAVLRWRLTLADLPGGPIPFLIDWGDSEHPAQSAAPGLILRSFTIEHPDPQSLVPALTALGADVAVAQAPSFALVAVIAGPAGTAELR